jgi:hypothetical protein
LHFVEMTPGANDRICHPNTTGQNTSNVTSETNVCRDLERVHLTVS